MQRIISRFRVWPGASSTDPSGLRSNIAAVDSGWLQSWLGSQLVFATTDASLACAVMLFPLMLRVVRLSPESVELGLVRAARALRTFPIRPTLQRLAAACFPLRWRGRCRLSLASVVLAITGLLASEWPGRRPRIGVGT